MEYSKTFSFPKIAFYGKRKVNTPEVEMRLSDSDKGPVLSICASVWNATHIDVLMCGQCLDHLKHFLRRDPLFNSLYSLWKKWHLNDMTPGTHKQEEALRDYNGSHDYDSICNYLKSIGLYEDDGYVYGSSWLYREIDAADLNEIKSLLNIT